MIDKSYSVINIFCTLIFAIIVLKEMLSKQKKDYYFTALITSILVFSVINCTWGLVSTQTLKTSKYTFYFLNVVLYLFKVLDSFLCLIYVDSKLNGIFCKNKLPIYVVSLPVLAVCILLITNRYTNLIFIHKSFTEFENGKYWLLFMAVQILNYLIAMSECFIVLAKEKDIIKKRKIKALIGFVFIILIATLCKLKNVQIPFLIMSFVLAILLIYIFNSTEEAMQLNIKLHEAENFKKIATNEKILSAITDSHESLYMFRVNGGNPVILKSNGERTFSDANQFLSEIIKESVDEDYVEKMRLFINLASLEERMDEKNIISTEFKGKNEKWYRASWIRVSTDEEGFIDKVLYSVIDIDEEKNREIEYQKKLKTALENQNEMYTEIFQMQSNGIIVTDMEDNILTINDTALRFFGIDKNIAVSAILDEITSKYLKDRKESIYKRLHSVKVRGGHYGFEFVIEKENEENLYMFAESKLVKTAIGKKILITSFLDITKNKKIENDLLLLSETDSLTKINNRSSGSKKIEYLLRKHKSGMLCLFNADKFKQINDNYGHIAGDKVLVAISECMKKVFREKDILMRLGGDEFAIYAVGITQEDQAEICINRLFDELEKIKIKEIDNKQICLSVGIVFCTQFTTRSFDDLYQMADKAMYNSKSFEGNHLEFYKQN